MKSYRFLSVAWLITAMPCGSDVAGPDDSCGTVPLPLSTLAAAPVVVAVSLEVQPGGIVVLATATDAQGSDNLLDVEQSISVFTNAECNGAPLEITDDLAGSGVEESFGTVVAAADEPGLYADIAAASSWPVAVDFRDRDGNRTAGRVMAAVTAP